MQPFKMWSFSLMTDRKHNNLLDRTRLHSDKPSFAHRIEMNSASLAFLLAPAQRRNVCWRQAKWSDDGARARLRVNVKRGDFLRTLGGAMTAQCKVLHLLFSQSDYPDIWASCHSECASFVSVGGLRLAGGKTRFLRHPATSLAWLPDQYVYALLIE